MPVIDLNKEYLKRLLQDLPPDKLNWEEIRRSIPMMGASYEREDEESISFEFFPNRPDLYSVEGVARAYRSFVTSEPLSPDIYRLVDESGVRVVVEKNVLSVRPYIGGVLVEGVQIDEDSLLSLMNLQEKLHLTLGRGRKKMAIGVHDYAPIQPPFRYLAVKPDEIEFLPLQGSREMTLREILMEHEKGVEYAHTLEGFSLYPIIIDKKNNVLSFPPIINGELTRVTEETTDIFVDCTGTSLRAVEDALKIITAQLIDLGGKAKSVEIVYPSPPPPGATEKIVSPPFQWEVMKVPVADAKALLGVEKDDGFEEALRRMGYTVKVEEGELIVKIPPMRVDILHPVDIYEDLAIGFGYDNFSGVLPHTPSIGEGRGVMHLINLLREVMIGLGYQEVKTLTMVDRGDVEFLDENNEIGVEVINPLSEEHSALRPSLHSSLLGFLKLNRHRELPQRIFEIGEVVKEGVNHWELGGMVVQKGIGFTDVKSTVEHIMRVLGIETKVERVDKKIYIRGRAATLLSKDNVMLGDMGEVHPEILHRYEISYPTVSFRLDVERIFEMWRER
ncbi:MAG: phenylalanine--tRNA ligase subunit beta [Thermoprotei archaeon]|nr:MAG: phenylalanine--tRNA ligase subunit beta [Thermoprotei archaeon]